MAVTKPNFSVKKYKIRGAYLLSEVVAKTKNLNMECLAWVQMVMFLIANLPQKAISVLP